MAAPVYTFYKNDGSGVMETLPMEPMILFPDPANDFGWGGSFKEWNDDPDGAGETYAIGDEIFMGTRYYYAIWNPITYSTTDKELKSIADAIRTKGGTSAQLQFPTGFVSAVEAISTGITPTGTKQISITQNGTITEDVTSYANAEIAVNVSGTTPTGTKQISITQNGTITEDVTSYANAEIAVNVSGTTPTGTKQISITQNGTITEDVSGYANAEIAVNVSGGESTSTGVSDVNFYDYDGSIVVSYTTAEFIELTELPPNPIHTGLVSQGWNYSLTDAKSHVRNYGKLNIGQMYITDDGKTRIYIHLEEGRLSPMLGVCPNGTVTVDWGDNTTPDTITGSSVYTVKWTGNHDYTAPGDYIITLTVSGSMDLCGSSGAQLGSCLLRHSINATGTNMVYQNAIQRVEIGSNVTALRTYAFHSCSNLTSITIPSTVTTIGSYAFQNCYNLKSITIPSGVSRIGSTASYAFYCCYSLVSISIPFYVTEIGSYAFAQCHSLTSITLPHRVTYIRDNAFLYCTSLTSMTIPDLTTHIGDQAFRYCYNLTSITIPSGMLTIGKYAFDDCYSLSYITLPSGVTSIGDQAFRYCYSLKHIMIPNNVTAIMSSTFFCCYSLSSITIPSGVTDIAASAFGSCYGAGYIKFISSTPPTVANSNAWSNLSTDCKIYVPAGSLSAYTSATNYPSSSTYTYVEY